MPIIKLFGPPDPQSSKVIGTADVVNMLPVMGADGRLAWIQRPGLTPVTITNWPTGNLRGWITAGDYLYAVVGSNFVVVTRDLVASVYNELYTSDGPCYLAYNLFKVCVTDGEYGYVFNADEWVDTVFGSGDFEDIESFTGGRGMTFLNGFLLSGGNATEDFDTIRCYASKVYDAKTWGGLAFGAVESTPDPLLRVEAVKDSAVMYGSESTEVWSYTPDGSSFPFSYLPGTAINYGLAAIQSVAPFQGSRVALMRSGNSVVPGIIDGYNLVPLTKDYPSVALEWGKYERVDDAIGCSYTLNGGPVYQITFPTANKTWVYDGTTGSWVRFETNGGAFLGLYAADINGQTYVATQDGQIYKFDNEKSADDTTPTRFELTSNTVRGYSSFSSVNKITLDVETGNTPSLPTATEYDPAINIAISADGGYTYRPAKTVSIGQQGRYKTRVTARRFGGRVKNLVVRVFGTSTLLRHVIMSEAEAEIENE